MQAHGTHRYAVLFYTLLLTMAMGPFLTALRFSADLLQIFVAFSLLVALLDVPGTKRRAALLLVAAVAIALNAVPASEIGAGLATGALLIVLAVALLATARAVRFALRARVIGAEQVYAALNAYLLAGLFFGMLHWSIESAWPGSYTEAGSEPRAFGLSTAIYYSFVTLATLGYGDVVPRSEVARGVAVFEAVGGQLYIAVTVARLVGSYVQSSSDAGRQTGRDASRRRPDE